MYEVGGGNDRNEEEFDVDGLVEVDQFESLLLSEGGVIDLFGVLYLFVYVDLAVGVLNVKGEQEFLGL